MGLRSTYRRCRFWQKKIIFSDEAHFDLGGYVNKQNCCIWGTENPHAYIEKSTHSKRVTVWCGENEQREAITFNGEQRWTKFCSKKLQRRLLAIFSFNRMMLRATQARLHSMFCALFLKIALSTAELMSFGHLGAAIWHVWTIICELPSMISVTPTSQGQLML